jgi:hypothetical protein
VCGESYDPLSEERVFKAHPHVAQVPLLPQDVARNEGLEGATDPRGSYNTELASPSGICRLAPSSVMTATNIFRWIAVSFFHNCVLEGPYCRTSQSGACLKARAPSTKHLPGAANFSLGTAKLKYHFHVEPAPLAKLGPGSSRDRHPWRREERTHSALNRYPAKLAEFGRGTGADEGQGAQ